MSRLLYWKTLKSLGEKQSDEKQVVLSIARSITAHIQVYIVSYYLRLAKKKKLTFFSYLQQLMLFPTTSMRHSNSAEMSASAQMKAVSWSSVTTNHLSFVRPSSQMLFNSLARFLVFLWSNENKKNNKRNKNVTKACEFFCCHFLSLNALGCCKPV